MVALVGPSGAGKSSIAELLTGRYGPKTGEIWGGGEPGHVSVQMHDYPEHRFRHTGATRQLIQAAGLIESLPLGYDTRVGERGYRLSGGQRQLLSLARAILRDPELLILDEATSALDSQRERLVQEAIERFERNHTVLVSTYWLSATLRADKILVLEADRIVEQRNHVSLLVQNGLYNQP